MSSLTPVFRRPNITEKGWGREIEIANRPQYCGKILEFNKGSKFSMHYHLIKEESFYILSGSIQFFYYNLETAKLYSATCKQGQIIDIPKGCPHMIEVVDEARIMEVSTTHYDSDSYRILPGDSQLKK